MVESNKYDISVVLATLNRLHFLKKAIASIRNEIRNGELSAEIIVVEGGSNDGTFEWLSEQNDIKLINQQEANNTENKNSWGFFINLGFKAAGGNLICMLSDDCILHENAIINAVKYINTDKSKSNLGALAFNFNDWPVRKEYAVAENLGQIYVNHGLFFKAALEEIAYADEDNFAFYAADTDLCLRLKERGYSVDIAENSFVEHFNDDQPGVKPSSRFDPKKDLETLLKRWQNKAFPENLTEYYRKNPGRWVLSSKQPENDYHKQFLNSLMETGEKKRAKRAQKIAERGLSVLDKLKIFYREIKNKKKLS